MYWWRHHEESLFHELEQGALGKRYGLCKSPAIWRQMSPGRILSTLTVFIWEILSSELGACCSGVKPFWGAKKDKVLWTLFVCVMAGSFTASLESTGDISDVKDTLALPS